jgi:hypothetical protein
MPCTRLRLRLRIRLLLAAVVSLGFHGAVASAAPSPAFEIRGTLPWHNFLSGPTAWNERDYEAYLDELAARGLNFVGFHCYTGGAERYAPYVEPMIRVRYGGVLPEAGFDTSLTARWGYRPMPVKEFGWGTDRLFGMRGAFGADCAVKARSTEDRYRRAQSLMRRVLAMAHTRGIRMAMGFEFGVHPPELASIVPPDSRIPGAMLPDPTHPANLEILRATVDDLLDAYPGIDWIWLWLHEHSMFVAPPRLEGAFGDLHRRERVHFADATNEHDVFTGVWSLAHIRQVHTHLARRSPRTRLAIGGWGGGPQLPPVLRGLDRALPPDIAFGCLNPGMGAGAHAPVLAEFARRRPTWAIPWFESDGSLWHLQLRAASMSRQVQAAHADGLSGVIGIHWRTEEVRPNLEIFAQAAADPAGAPVGEACYRQYCATRYGPGSVDALAPLLARLEREGELGGLASPEFYPYEPAWGRVPAPLADRLREALAQVERLRDGTRSSPHRSNLAWLADNFRFALTLDAVGRHLEPAHALKARVLRGEVAEPDWPGLAGIARRELESAPMEELFRTFARRVRSRGELGELSSLNQKLGGLHRELRTFLENSTAPGEPSSRPSGSRPEGGAPSGFGR